MSFFFQVEVDPGFWKGWWRRGQAKTGRLFHKGALSDYEQALQLAPGNSVLQKTITKARKEVRKDAGTTSAKVCIGYLISIHIIRHSELAIYVIIHVLLVLPRLRKSLMRTKKCHLLREKITNKTLSV